VIYTICQTLAIGSAGLTHKRDMLKPMALKPSGLLSKVEYTGIYDVFTELYII
jgi:hypothetical protein